MTTMTMPISSDFRSDAAGAAGQFPAAWWLVPAVVSGGGIWVWAILSILA